jgi:hypothetical protein
MFHRFPKGNVRKTGQGKKLPRLRGLPQIPLLPCPDIPRGQCISAILKRYLLTCLVLPEVLLMALSLVLPLAELPPESPVGLLMDLPAESSTESPLEPAAVEPTFLPAAEPALRLPEDLPYCPRQNWRLTAHRAGPDGCPL